MRRSFCDMCKREEGAHVGAYTSDDLLTDFLSCTFNMDENKRFGIEIKFSREFINHHKEWQTVSGHPNCDLCLACRIDVTLKALGERKQHEGAE